MSKWAVYAVASGALVGVAAGLVSLAFEASTRSGIWAGLAIAWLVQLLAFAILIGFTQRRPQLIVAGWTVGTFLRLAVLMGLAWLTLAGTLTLPPEPTLIALTVALFALLILEPVVFRHAKGTR